MQAREVKVSPAGPQDLDPDCPPASPHRPVPRFPRDSSLQLNSGSWKPTTWGATATVPTGLSSRPDHPGQLACKPNSPLRRGAME